MNSNKKNIIKVITIFLIVILTIAGSFALWTWNGNNSTVSFNSAKDLYQYINYDEGESKFVGDFKICDTYTEGVHTTISINKVNAAVNIPLYATINLTVIWDDWILYLYSSDNLQ